MISERKRPVFFSNRFRGTRRPFTRIFKYFYNWIQIQLKKNINKYLPIHEKMKINFQFKFNPLANFSLFDETRMMLVIKNQLTIQSRTLFSIECFYRLSSTLQICIAWRQKVCVWFICRRIFGRYTNFYLVKTFTLLLQGKRGGWKLMFVICHEMCFFSLSFSYVVYDWR